MLSTTNLFAVGLCLATLLFACRDSRTSVAEATALGDGDEVVARFGGEEITVAQVDARILGLPAVERPSAGTDLDLWYQDQVRQLAVDRRLRAEAEEGNLAADEIVVRARAEEATQLTVQLCLARLRPDVDRISDDDLRTAYEARVDALRTPERRLTFHIFLRSNAAHPKDSRRVEADALRHRVLAGESFHRLAATHSDSESRHRDGSLLWVTRGQLPTGFEDVVFGLEEGVPSEPVMTRDGVHLFYVSQVLPQKVLAFDEARDRLEQSLIAERRGAALIEIEGTIEPPTDSVWIDRERFESIVASDDREAVLLRIDGTEETLDDLRQRLRSVLARESGERPGKPFGDLAWSLLEQLRRRELIAGHCRRQEVVAPDDVERRLDDWQEKTLIRVQRQRRLVEVAGRDDERLRRFYESNVGSFSGPPRWHLRRLRIPLGNDASTVMAALERAAAGQRSTLETLRSEFGGEIDDLGLRSFAELQRIEPKLPSLVSGRLAGALSAPYRGAATLDIAEVVERRDSEAIPLAEIRERVALAYVEQYTQEVYEELAAEILAGTDLRFEPEGLARLRRPGLMQPDVSVEELESLLEEI